FFQAEDGIRDFHVTGVQTCALPICNKPNKNQKQHTKSTNTQEVTTEVNVDADKALSKEPMADEAVAETEKPAQNQNRNKNQNQKKQNYRDPDYEFEGIIECEGVLEVPKDGG